MLTTQLLAYINRVDSIGITKTMLRIEHRVNHGPVGDDEFEDALRGLLSKRYVRSTVDGLTGSTRYFIAKKGSDIIGY